MAMLLQSFSDDSEERDVHCEALFRQLEIILNSGGVERLLRSSKSTSERYESDDETSSPFVPGGRLKERVREEVSFRSELNMPEKGIMEVPSNVIYINSSDYALNKLSQLLEKSGMAERPALTVLDILLEKALNDRNRLFAQKLSRAMQENNEAEVSNLRELFSRFDKAILKFMPQYKLIDTSSLSFRRKDTDTVEIQIFPYVDR